MVLTPARLINMLSKESLLELYSSLFKPRGVAVIGATPKEGKIGRIVVENLVKAEFKGKIYPVNPKYSEILGLRAYSSVLEVPDPLDVVIVAVPAPIVPKVIEECGKRGVRIAIVLSAGFSEAGRKDLELELLNRARKYDVRIIGPNCAGVVVPSIGFHASFEELMSPGNIAVIGQSGAYITALAAELERRGLGVSAFISYGNRVDLDEELLLRLLLIHEETKVIIYYVEGLRIGMGRRILNTLKEVTMEKPVVIHKAGVMEAGARAVASHTGSLAGTYRLYEAAFKQAGAFIVNDIDLMLDAAHVLLLPINIDLTTSIPVIVTNSGGHGVVIADHLEMLGIRVPELPSDIRYKLKEHLPPHASLSNPIDMLAEATAETYTKVTKLLLSDERIGVIIVVVNPPPFINACEICREVVREWDYSGRIKPIVFYLAGFNIEEAIQYLRKTKIPVTSTHRGIACMVKALYDRCSYLKRCRSRKIKS